RRPGGWAGEDFRDSSAALGPGAARRRRAPPPRPAARRERGPGRGRRGGARSRAQSANARPVSGHRRGERDSARHRAQQDRARAERGARVAAAVHARRLSGAADVGRGGGGAAGVAGPAAGPGVGAHRRIRGGEVESHERTLPGAQPADRRGQRVLGKREAHHARSAARAAGGARLRRGYAGAARGGDVGRGPGRARQLLPRVPPLSRRVPVRQLPSSHRARLRRAAGGRGRDLRPGPAPLLPAHVRGSQRSFLVQRSASREVTFRIIAANAASRSIPCELARQITTNRTSASSIATEPSASSVRLVFSPNRWLISRASSPTSSVSRATLVSGGKYPSLYWPIQRSTVCCASRRDKGGSEES